MAATYVSQTQDERGEGEVSTHKKLDNWVLLRILLALIQLPNILRRLDRIEPHPSIAQTSEDIIPWRLLGTDDVVYDGLGRGWSEDNLRDGLTGVVDGEPGDALEVWSA